MTNKFRFAILAFDAGQLVARKNGSFPLVVTVLPRHEYAEGDTTLANCRTGEVRGQEQASSKASGSTKSMSGMVIPTLRRFLGYTVVAPGY